MASLVSLGNFFNVNGRTVIGGVGGSGLDTNALINALVSAKQAPAKKLQDTIDLNTKKLSALDDYKKFSAALKDATNFLRNPPGVNNATDNGFEYRKADVGSNTSTAGSTYLSVTAASGAAVQNYSITNITHIAAAKKQTSETFNLTNADTSVVVAAAPGASQFKAGTITIRGQNIILNAGDTLNQVAAKFNAVKGATGIAATVVQVSTGGATNDFQINFSATQTGTAHDFDLNSPLLVSDPTGVMANITFANTQPADDTIFNFDGVPITRSSTSITDVVNGVTFNFLQKPAGDPLDTTLNVNITADTTAAQNAITNFVNAYNDLKIFYSKQTETNDDGSLKDTAILGNSQGLRGGMSSLTNQITGSVAGLPNGALSTLASLGITFIDVPASGDTPATRNVLTIDSEKLSSALDSNFDQVRSVFEFSQSSTNPNFKIYSRSNATPINSFDVSVTVPLKELQQTQLFALADANQQLVFTTPGADQFGAGTFTFKGADITLVDGDTLNQVAQKFNDKVAKTGVYADVVEETPGNFRLKFSAANAGLAGSYDFNGADLTDGSGVFANITVAETQAAADGIYQATYTPPGGGAPTTIDLDGSPLGTSGFSLKGQAGTVLDGMTIVFGGTTDQTGTISFTQGLADKAYNVADPLTTDNTGTIDTEKSDVQSNSDRLNSEITRINDQVAQLKETLINKFAALEKAISQVNSLLTLLDANDKARQQASS